MRVLPLSYYINKFEIYSQVQWIFFESSGRAKELEGEERRAFEDKWLKPYWTNHSDSFFLAEENGQVLGYNSLCLDTASFMEHFPLSGYDSFKELLTQYPAHLHINCHPLSRGKGVGSALVERSIQYCRRSFVSGLHVITSPNASNVYFYRKKGFLDEYEGRVGEHPVLFMGMRLEPM